MKKLLLSVTVIILSFSLNLMAQDYAKEGIWEVGGRINYTSTTYVSNGETAEHSYNVFSLHVPYYYFPIDGLEVGLIPGYENVSYGDNSASALDISLGLAYNFQTKGNAYPFLEGRIGYNSTSNGDAKSGMVWLLAGGVKLQVGGNALVSIGFAYEQSTLENSDNEEGRDGSNAWGIDAGFAVFFGK